MIWFISVINLFFNQDVKGRDTTLFLSSSKVHYTRLERKMLRDGTPGTGSSKIPPQNSQPGPKKHRAGPAMQGACSEAVTRELLSHDKVTELSLCMWNMASGLAGTQPNSTASQKSLLLTSYTSKGRTMAGECSGSALVELFNTTAPAAAFPTSGQKKNHHSSLKEQNEHLAETKQIISYMKINC